MAFSAPPCDEMARADDPEVAHPLIRNITTDKKHHMPRIYHVLPSVDLGGAAQIALFLAQDLQARGQISQVWIPGDGRAKAKAEQLGLIVHTYDAIGLFSSSFPKVLTTNFHIWRKMCGSPDLLHFHSPFVYRALLPLLKSLRIPTIVHIHLDEEQAGLRWALKHPPDLIITCARFLEAYVRQTLSLRCQSIQRIIPMPNFVDIQKFYPGDRRKAKELVGASPNIPLALMLANLAPHKGQDVAIRAIAILKKQGLTINLWLAGTERGGEANYTRTLHSLSCELDVTAQVRFLGYRSDTPDLLRAADLFLLPSTREGMPLSILEAQACQVPVLAAPTIGIPEIITDGQTGFLIPTTEISCYAEHIKLLLGNSGLTRTIVDNAYLKITSAHTSQSYSHHISVLYEDLLNSNHQNRHIAKLFRLIS